MAPSATAEGAQAQATVGPKAQEQAPQQQQQQQQQQQGGVSF